jgi:hypothetical protein
MAFDKSTRNKLQKFVAEARAVLSEEFIRQMQAIYGLDPKTGSVGEIGTLAYLDNRQRETARLLRETLAHYVAVPSAGTQSTRTAQALERLVREQAFTVLNRLAAVRMAEARGFLLESIAKGHISSGFQLYRQIAGGALGETGDAYRHYLFSLFDEFSADLAVLFDRDSTQSLLFPRDSALSALLDLLNAPDLEALWAEDETIGWIYQYYNDQDERRKMRKESAAPRNSRELAVRNQFFTPRYVVEFLTDNTLGRIWYEMTRGQTLLADQCRYLVRHSCEVFLDEGETSTVAPAHEGLCQGGILCQPIHISYRARKDPREIRLLDPACGSMHFGLYAFDLFETIYEEAWDSGSCAALHAAYSEKREFIRDVPRLIIEQNIHGIDIDSRAVQIAGLSLWLRAQRAWQASGVKPADRPRIRRANIVCAEPMPGSPDMLLGFVATLDPPLLGELVKTVFDKMQLAGAAGSLLRIEDELRGAIENARRAWEKCGSLGPVLFSAEELNRTLRRGAQLELTGIERAVSAGRQSLESGFWETAEQQVLDALRTYAEYADAETYQRRLFADDAARGFAFIDLCRKRYDAVVMNPPFGEPVSDTVGYIKSNYPDAFIDILAAFLERSRGLCEMGKVGAITSRACLYTKTLSRWRLGCFLPSVDCVADLGGGVLDGAMVFACASTFTTPVSSLTHCTAFDLRRSNDPSSNLLAHIGGAFRGESNQATYLPLRSRLMETSDARFLYNIPTKFWEWARGSKTLADCGGSARAGSTTYDDYRFLRLAWEVAAKRLGWKNTWVYFSKGGYFETYYNDIHLVVNWDKDGKEVGEFNRIGYGTNAQSRRASSYYRLAGVTYPRRTVKGFSPRNLPKDCIFADKGPVIFSPGGFANSFSLAYWNAAPIRALIHLQIQAGSFETGVINSIPWPQSSNIASEVSMLADEIWTGKASVYALEETDRIFRPLSYSTFCSLGDVRTFVEHAFTSSSDRAVVLNSRVSDLIATAYSLPELDIESFEISEDDHRIEEHSDLIRPRSVAECSVSFVIGAAFGRWDIRYAAGACQPPALPSPFDPLPACPPGMLQNDEGLPCEPKKVPADYPLRISWSGILVDDEDHPEDIVARVRGAMEVIWKDHAEAIEQEACEILCVRTLRDYFSRSAGFFADHLNRYSKSRRQAPIYWPLSTKSGSYTLWLYYHRLSEQSLYACVNDFVEPKIRSIAARLAAMRMQLARSAKEEREFTRLVDLAVELNDLRDELLRVAKFWKPNLNDGVQITAAPLWACFGLKPWQITLKDTWKKLEQGDFDWAHLACSIWPARVLRKCHQDRSLAIAHGLEDVFWQEAEVVVGRGNKVQGKSKAGFVPKPLSSSQLDDLVHRLAQDMEHGS